MKEAEGFVVATNDHLGRQTQDVFSGPFFGFSSFVLQPTLMYIGCFLLDISRLHQIILTVDDDLSHCVHLDRRITSTEIPDWTKNTVVALKYFTTHGIELIQRQHCFEKLVIPKIQKKMGADSIIVVTKTRNGFITKQSQGSSETTEPWEENEG